jgi:predicted membrane GTPase involved in stress response
MSRVRQPPSKDKLVAAAELTNFKPNSKQRKADLRNAMSYLAIMPNPFLEVFPKRVRRARKLLRKAKRKQAKRNSKRR